MLRGGRRSPFPTWRSFLRNCQHLRGEEVPPPFADDFRSTTASDKLLTMETWDITLRLTAAALVGAALGLNRDLHGKRTGVRTLGLVGLGSALTVLSVSELSGADASRVIQGIVTGVGFIGAGVIVRNGGRHSVHGLTTAACVWLTACIGAACAFAQWRVIFISMPLVFLILLLGGPFEKAIHRRWPGNDKADAGDELPR